ncbi:hypothetical protein MNU08_28365 [Klebsiella pneumoniae]|nr:hypothetical protein [Klebsiella pneumoniae]
MGSRITVPGYFGDKGLGFDPLVRRGLKYLNFYGEADKTGRNLAPDGVAATVLGSPVVQENGVQFTPAGTLLDTGILQSADFTFFTIFNCPTLSQILLLSNFNGPRQSGSGTTQGVVLRTQPSSTNMTLNFSVNTINGGVSTQRTVGSGVAQTQTICCAALNQAENGFQNPEQGAVRRKHDMGDPAIWGQNCVSAELPADYERGIHRFCLHMCVTM